MKNLNKSENKSKQETNNDNVFVMSTEQLQEIRSAAMERVKNTTHEWRQRGVYLVCTSCEFEHAIHIGTNKMFKGTNKEGGLEFEELTF